jgi:hypothetical protein
VQEYAATVARRNLYYEVRAKEGVGPGGIYADLLAFLDDAQVQQQNGTPAPFFHPHHGPSVYWRQGRAVPSPVSLPYVPPRMAWHGMQVRHSTGIVYCRKRETCDDVARILASKGCNVAGTLNMFIE